MFQVDNQELSLGMEFLALLVHQSVDGKWKPKTKSSVSVDEGGQRIVAMLLNQHAYDKLIDFDNHLDDITRDWSNKVLNTEIEELIQLEK